jgi:hypothetical protein
VSILFEKIFDYSITIDPRYHKGILVEKSDENGLHDGRIIQGPLASPRDDCVYQKFIDTQVDDEFVDQLRLPIFNGNIPFALIKYKRISNPFACSEWGSWAEVSDHLTREEVILIQKFCTEIGLDYGELDVLRDRTEGRIYIVDANKTPTIRFDGYKMKDAQEIMRRMAEAFQKAFVDHG